MESTPPYEALKLLKHTSVWMQQNGYIILFYVSSYWVEDFWGKPVCCCAVQYTAQLFGTGWMSMMGGRIESPKKLLITFLTTNFNLNMVIPIQPEKYNTSPELKGSLNILGIFSFNTKPIIEVALTHRSPPHSHLLLEWQWRKTVVGDPKSDRKQLPYD